MFSWDDVISFAPEIFLTISVLLGVPINVLRGRTQKQGDYRLMQVGMGILAVTFALVVFGPVKSSFFNGALKITPLICSFKEGLLLTALGVFSVSLISWGFRLNFVVEYPSLLLLSVLGGMVAFSANDFLLLFLGLELQTLPLYILIAIDRRSSLSAEAGMKYFVLGSLSTGFLLFGISLLYGAVGTIDFGIFRSLVSLSSEMGMGWGTFPPHFFLGIVLILCSLFFKLSLVPFHMWAPDVYEGAPTVTVLFIASCVKLVAIFVMMRLFLGPFAAVHPFFQDFLGMIAGLSMIVGALGGMAQTSVKRLLAYSGIGHIGHMLGAVVVGGSAGAAVLLAYLMVYMPMTILVFTLLMILSKNHEHARFQLVDLKGLARRFPTFACVASALLLSLAGVPPLGGFFGKLSILLVLVQEHIFLAIVAVISSVLSCYYYLSIIRLIYFEKGQEGPVTPSNDWGLSLQGRVVVVILIVLSLGFGVLFPFLVPFVGSVV